MDSKDRRQRKYLKQMLNKSMKNTKEFNTEIMEETHNSIMKEIKEKNKVSPNGGLKPFKTSDDR